MQHAACSEKKCNAMMSDGALCQLYPNFMMHQGRDYYRCQAEHYEAVLHELHHRRQDDQVCVERVEDGPVDVATLGGGAKYIHQKTMMECFSTSEIDRDSLAIYTPIRQYVIFGYCNNVILQMQ